MNKNSSSLDNLVFEKTQTFIQILQAVGISVSLNQKLDALNALAFIDPFDQEVMFFTLRSNLISQISDLDLFEETFYTYWLNYRKNFYTASPNSKKEYDKYSSQIDAIENSDTREKLLPVVAFSDIEKLKDVDFSKLSQEEEDQVLKFIVSIKWRELATKKSMRFNPSPSGLLDFKSSLRKNMRYGGEILYREYKKPKEKSRPIVVLADVSNSMQAYTKIILQLAYSLSRNLEKVYTFLFSTRLHSISKHLEHSSPAVAINSTFENQDIWASGTRIGEALKDFNLNWSKRINSWDGIIVIVSDGLDQGDISKIAYQMNYLQRTHHKIIWLNPYAGSPEYKPTAKGMAAALPFIDQFKPIHTLQSLLDLANVLE